MQTLIDALGRETEAVAGLAFVLTAGVVLIVVVGIVQWRKLRQAETEAALKGQMLERGMSADEIVRVISVGLGKSPPSTSADAARSHEVADYPR